MDDLAEGGDFAEEDVGLVFGTGDDAGFEETGMAHRHVEVELEEFGAAGEAGFAGGDLQAFDQVLGETIVQIAAGEIIDRERAIACLNRDRKRGICWWNRRRRRCREWP